MKQNLREFYRYRELLFTIAYRDIKVRYKQSVMGILWAVLMPILIVLSGVVVRYAYTLAAHSALRTADIADIAVKSLPWAFLVSSIRFGCNSLITNRDLVTKVYFPKEIFPLAAVLSSFFDLAIASIALFVLLLILGIGWGIYLLWIPLLLLAMVSIASGASMLLSAASLFFRDVKFLVEVFLTFGIFFTPVFYDIRMLGKKGEWLLLNPAASIIECFSTSIVHHQSPQLPWLIYSCVVGGLMFVIGYMFFKYLEPAFAESI